MKFLPTNINMPNIKVNNAERQCSISFGQNVKTKHYVTNKKQQGFGEQSGDRVLVHKPIGEVIDIDFSDNQ
ncbi:hypothetical protein [Halobacillus salinus]|uniref:Uncharacterized protein n=1 Tax=Halobacillus salinus TaxID=192814 RepID=A0A4Z0GX72_9BACI|nr:hypothetical protein [Halobacillus salinus]TGB01983.1 hypothetical protein E4663_15240 [Halobacillus salinus]